MNNGPLTPETTLSLMQATQVKEPNAAMMKNAKRIDDAAREFEAVFISEMMKPMFEGIKADELFGGGKGEEIFRGMLLQEYGTQIAQQDITGIQTQVKNKLIEMQAERTARNQSPALQAGTIQDLDVIKED